MGKKSKIVLTGQKINRLFVESEHPVRTKSAEVQWRCKCDCGNTTIIPGRDIRSGRVKSCGCLRDEYHKESRKTHGMTGTKVYHSWMNIKARCYNPCHINYNLYGAKGIKLHESFLEDFEAFYAEIGNPPDESELWSVDRIDGKKDYEPGNIRWATPSQQARNLNMYYNNTSGVTGVSYCKNGEREYWIAQWYSLEGKRVSKSFNIAKYGIDVAFLLACEQRRRIIRELQEKGAGYTETHGK